MLAHALGGLSKPSKNGPEVGLSTFTLSSEARNLPVFAQQWRQLQKVNLIAIHSDEVVELPRGAISLGSNDHCLYQGMILPCRVLSFQGHPEFSAKPEVYEAILTHVAKFPEEIKSQGLEALTSSFTDHIWVASCIRDFILQKTLIPE
ncbi:Putative glutamine amidotransferase-like protein [Galdieria sulphuraria]|nr:Putative glutamine amidotransferase-like protein [Galdieria sulphuraria]